MGSIVGAITGNSAAKKQAKATENAAKKQADATKYSSDLQKQMFDDARSDQQPYMQAGKNALAQLAGLKTGSYDGGTFSYNGSKDAYTSPEFSFEESPSYQFRKEQGMDGIQGSAAARGGLQSGATLKALNTYNSNLASQEYDNAHNQYLQSEQLKANQHQQAFNNWQSQDNNAYSRFMTDQNNEYNRLFNLVGLGQSAASGVGSAGIQTGQAIANNTMAGANAQATGMIGAANARAEGTQAIGQGLGSLIGGVGNFIKTGKFI